MADEWADRKMFARCSLGNGRWFWCAWLNYHALCEGQMLGSGYAATAAEAEGAAREVVPDGEQWVAGCAANYHRKLCCQRRAAQPGKGHKGAAALEFLYTHWQDEQDCAWHSTPHLVVKKTAKKVFVEKRRYLPDREPNGDWRDHYDRETL